ncbi:MULTISPECIES: hypothetical protein [Methylobacter]
MPTIPKLDEMLIKAVQTSMRVEGYQPAHNEQFKQQAKQLMEQKVSKYQVKKDCITHIKGICETPRSLK